MKRISRSYGVSASIVFFFLTISFLLAFPPLAEPNSSIIPLNHRVIGAEYSKQLDRIITISATPENQLHVVDAVTGGSVAVDLPLTPACVSVGPDGLFAAVGHNGWISYVDLTIPALLKTLPVTTDVLDIVLGGNGWAYVFPRYGQWTTIRCVNLESGEEVPSSGMSIYSGTLAKLHPGGKAIYGADNGLSPSDIEKYDITGGPASYLYDSPYHGDYPMCGNLWMSEDGFRIFTRCGRVFSSSESREEDMLYSGSLGNIGRVIDLSHSAAVNKVLAISDQGNNSDTEIWKYDYTYLNFESKITLPAFSVNGLSYLSHGRFVFFSADGARYSVVVQADASSGMLFDYGIFTVGPESRQFTISASAGAGGKITPSGELPAFDGSSMTFIISPDPGYEIANVQVDGVSVGKMTSYTFENIIETHTIDVTFSQLAQALIRRLNHRVIDAEYSKPLDRIVTVSPTPKNQLHVVDPVTGWSVAVDLPITPACVSVGPDGLFAAVGHDGWISYVDLTIPSLIKMLPVTTDVLDIVLAGNGWVYAFPRYNQWSAIRSVNLESGEEVPSSGMSIYSGTLAKLHPSGKAIYGADNGLSPSDIEKYDITGGPASYLYDSPYHGDYAMCGNLWISEDGFRIFTRCGNVFRSSESRAEDMLYNGSLEGIGQIVELSHSTYANKVLAIPKNMYGQPANRDAEIWKYNYESLSFESKVTLPAFSVNGLSYLSHGRFVFFSADGARFSVVVQADGSSGMELDFGIFAVGPDSETFTIGASAGPGGTITPSGDVRVIAGGSMTFTISPDPGYGVADVLVDGVSVGKVISYTFENIIRNHTIEASFDQFSNALITPLNHRVIDAEYSKPLDRIVTVSSTPTNRLHVVDPVTGWSVAVDLPLTPACVSVGPDGLFAAVGHNGRISYVDLTIPALLKTLPVTTDVLDIVLGGNGWAYVFPRYGQWTTIRCVNLESGEEVPSSGMSIYSGTLAKLHPGGKAIYGADNGLSPSDIEKYDITGGPASYLYDSPYHGDYPMCGNLWISEDGFRIFTQCGNIFRSSESRAEDMLYNGSLEGIGQIVELSHSTYANKVLAIPKNMYGQPANRDTEIWKYDYTYLNFESKISLPAFSVNGLSYLSHGRFVFFSADGARYSVVVQADESSGMLLDYGIFTMGTDAEHFTITASAGSGGTITPSGEVLVFEGNSINFNINPDPGFEVMDVLVDGVSVGKVKSYSFENISANHTIEAFFAHLSFAYFGIQIGNYQELVKPENENSPTRRIEVTSSDESYSEPTFIVEDRVGSRLKGRSWYQSIPDGLGLRKVESTTQLIEFSVPLLLAKGPLIAGDTWVSKAKTTISGVTCNVKLRVNVGKAKIINVPAGRFLAYPITYDMVVSNGWTQQSQQWTEWFAPYIGTVKASNVSWALAAFGVRGGTVSCPPPIVTKALPPTGIEGDRISINGFHFGNEQGAGLVAIGGIEVSQILSWSDTQIELIVPQGISSGPITVFTPEWESNDTTIFYVDVVRLTAPSDYGISMNSRENYEIRWTAHAEGRPVETVELLYTANEKAVPVMWKPIASFKPADYPGTYPWTVPTVSKTRTQCKVKVVLRDADGKKVGSDVSDNCR